eukprot:13106905-Alexandrium_andersonii.AAC.1
MSRGGKEANRTGRAWAAVASGPPTQEVPWWPPQGWAPPRTRSRPSSTRRSRPCGGRSRSPCRSPRASRWAPRCGRARRCGVPRFLASGAPRADSAAAARWLCCWRWRWCGLRCRCGCYCRCTA